MSLNKTVATYATQKGNAISIDLENLALDADFRSQVINQIVKKVKQHPDACVLFPSYKSKCGNNPLGGLINELALTLQVKTLVTGDVNNLKRLAMPVKEVIVIKQSFLTGKGLKKEIADIKQKTNNVSVFCLIAHPSKDELQIFAKENDVEIESLVNVSEVAKLTA